MRKSSQHVWSGIVAYFTVIASADPLLDAVMVQNNDKDADVTGILPLQYKRWQKHFCLAVLSNTTVL